jgi:hypothetical protein
MDIVLIRRMAAEELEKRAFAELTGEEDTSLDSIFLAKAAQAEDPELFRIAMRMQGDPIGNYEVLGGKYKVAVSIGKIKNIVENADVTADRLKSFMKRVGKHRPGPSGNYDSIVGARRAAAEEAAHGRYMQTSPLRGKPLKKESSQEDEILKQAFGQAMFRTAPAPDPKVQATGAKPPTASGPKAPSGPTGPTGGGGTGAPAVQSVPSPSVSGGPASAGAGVGMG